ncbi:MAG: PKD domain-containing protein [Candidatus Bathyarchaeota archaeon]|nr:PKD domain-containing protein [Candidatus Termitimicrobium sp.]
MPSAKAAELTPQQKALTLTTEVLRFDTTKYEIHVENYERSAEMGYLSVVPQHIVAYTLTSNHENGFRLSYTFANNNLQMITIYKDGSAQARSNYFIDVDVAKDFLAKYQNYAGNSLYNRLGSIIPVDSIPGNVTVSSEDIVLEITLTEDSTLFKWYYAVNGAEAPYSKFVSLEVGRGVLIAFVDNWHLYPVGSTCVGLSRDEALAVALEAARSHVWSLDVEASSLSVDNFNEDSVRWEGLVFMGSLNADSTRSEYLLELYPVWRFGIALDKWYGYMYGVEVDVWADTGEVRRVHEAWSSILPEEEEAFFAGMEEQTVVFDTGLSLSVLVVFSVCVAMVSGFAVVCMGGAKKLHYAGLFKRHGFKVSGVLFCIILSSTLFLGALETVNATTSRGAAVWGSESTYAGAYNPNPNNWVNWRKSYTETNYQRSICGDIGGFFQNGGYTGNGGINHQGLTGLGSAASQIRSDISALYYSKDYVAVVDFDHGVGRTDGYPGLNEFHYMFEDNNGTLKFPNDPPSERPGNAVYDWEVYNWVTQSKTAFVFISTCLSAETAGQGMLPPHLLVYPERAVSMPFAWTGRKVASLGVSGFDISTHISGDGYGSPDWGNQVYMGFRVGAASLEQSLSGPKGTYTYFDWVKSFLQNALTMDQSVNNALDEASRECTGLSFASSPLKNGFVPYWWNIYNTTPSKLEVYGNGNIHLKDFEPHTVSLPSIGGPTSGAVGVSHSFTVSSSVDSFGHRVRYIFDWADGTTTTTGYVNSGASVSVSHAWSTDGVYGVKVYAQCEDGSPSSLSGPYNVAIGTNPWLIIDAWDDYGNELNVGVYIDDQLVGGTPGAFMVTSGWHTLNVDWQIYIFTIFDSFSDGSDNCGYQLITSNTTLTANYRCT